MKKLIFTFFFIIVSSFVFANDSTKLTFVKIETTHGSMKIALYDDVLLHKENFIKLVENGFYEGVLFHRVIKDFMIQCGDPYSKIGDPQLRLGSGDLGYTIKSEIVFPKYYHKKGAIAAARRPDQVNPDRESSACQFYIVAGKTFSDEELDEFEFRLTQILNLNTRFKYTDEQRLMYKTLGGTPHLDGQYTVFGELIEGFDVLEKISNFPTDERDQPLEEVKIIKMKIVKR